MDQLKTRRDQMIYFVGYAIFVAIFMVCLGVWLVDWVDR